MTFPQQIDQINFACVARLDCMFKAQDVLISVFSNEKWLKRNWKLNFYGEGRDMQYLKELVNHYQLNSRVTFHGQVKVVDDIWRENHILLLPSLAEGTPLSLIEAMVCGRPSVVTDVGGNSDLIEDGTNGYIIPASNVKQCDLTIEKAWQNRDKWQGLGLEAKNQVLSKINFNSKIIFDRLCGRNFFLNGYFQSELYFNILERDIREIFKVKEELLTEEIQTQVSEFTNFESVAIHVRRGDYLKPEVLKHHGVCSAEYYQNAISQMNLKLNSPKYYIFSEDMDWVRKEILPIISECVLIESNNQKPSWLDLLYMSNCKHNIIANSSYSWWGAYLNYNPDKIVIAPLKWYKEESLNQKSADLIPKCWIRI